MSCDSVDEQELLFEVQQNEYKTRCLKKKSMYLFSKKDDLTKLINYEES